MKHNDVEKIKITFEYSSPNTSTAAFIFMAVLGTVLVVGLIILAVLWA